nr:transcriptional regulator [Micromonospora sp. DSM 115978]
MLDRRGFMVLGVGAAASLADQWLNIEPERLASVINGGRIDTNLVDCFERRLPALRQMDATLGGGSVLNLVDSELRLATDLLSRASYSTNTGARLLGVTAELGRVAGWASLDTGQVAAAERYWLAALRAAHSAHDRAAGANIMKCMSLQRVEVDRPHEALALARAACEGTRDAPARVGAMLAVRHARAHAALGHSQECERLLSRADQLMNRADDGSVPSWAGYFDRAEYCAQVASSYRELHRHKQADRWLSEALALQPASRSRDRATYLIWRADTVNQLGDVEHACALVEQAVPDIAVAKSVRVRRRLASIHGQLVKRSNAAVATLDDRIRALAASA